MTSQRRKQKTSYSKVMIKHHEKYSWPSLWFHLQRTRDNVGLERDSNYRESFVRLSKLRGILFCFEFPKDSNNGGSYKKEVIVETRPGRSRVKAGLHLSALRSHFFEQSFHAIGQKKNEAISFVRKKLKCIRLFFQAHATFLWRNLSSKQKGLKPKGALSTRAIRDRP